MAGQLNTKTHGEAVQKFDNPDVDYRPIRQYNSILNQKGIIWHNGVSVTTIRKQ